MNPTIAATAVSLQFSDLRLEKLSEELRGDRYCRRTLPLPEGLNTEVLIEALNKISAAQDNNVGRWKIVQTKDSIVFTLGVQDFVVIQDTGDMVDAVEGGFDTIYEVLFADVAGELGELTYSTRSFASPALASFQHSLGITPAPKPSGWHVHHINNMNTIYDDERDELIDRGITVIILPTNDSCLRPIFLAW